MELLLNLLLFLHLIGMAVLIGAFVAQVGQAALRITPGMLHGALTMLVTGLGLVWVVHVMHDDHPLTEPAVNIAKVAVKLLVLVAILVVILVNRKKEKVGVGPWLAVGLLSMLDVAVAVFWT